MTERRSLVSNRFKQMSLRRQCRVLSVNRSSLYYRPVEEKPENLKIMRLMDEHALKHPGEGVKSMVFMLQLKGYHVNQKRIRRLLRKMGHRTVYPKKSLSKLGLAQYIRPYLLHKLAIDRANKVWCIDITYIPMEKGFMYCTAIIDVFSRKIVGWGISNSLETKWCLQVLQEAIATHGIPDIINSDQGSQFTSSMWTSSLEDKQIQISMDGKGRAIDNRWIERFWRTLKYKYIYLNPPANGIELYEGVRAYIQYYNHEKIHHTLEQIPGECYQKSMQKINTNNPNIITKKTPLLV